jgi:hypothetical protein
VTATVGAVAQAGPRVETGSARRWIPTIVAALTAILVTGTSVGLVLGVDKIRHSSPGAIALTLVSSGELLFAVGFGAVGWLLTVRLPENPIGWCFAFGGLAWVTNAVIDAWVELAMGGHFDLTVLVRALAAHNVAGWLLSMPLSVQLPLLLLPDGRLLSRRWRPAVWVVLAGVAIGGIGFSTIPGVIEDTDPARHLTNPLGVRVLGPLPEVMALTGAGLLLVGMAAGIVAVVLRFRRSTGVERQQMRWVAFGACLVLLGPLTGFGTGIPGWVGNVGGAIGILGVPACVGVAVLRYRLYDLGRLVSRTVSYVVITALLLGVYFLLVTALAQLLPDGQPLAVAASTLAAAALFQPLRRRVQSVVDRRFNRSRYDADRTVEIFTRTLRQEVDLDAVRSGLITAVDDALQPTTTRLWLREPSGGW